MKKFVVVLILACIVPVYSLNAQKIKKYSGMNGKIKYIKDVKYGAKKIYGDIVPAKEVKDIIKTEFNNDGYQSRLEVYWHNNGDTVLFESEYIKDEIVSEMHKMRDRVEYRKRIKKNGNISEWELSDNKNKHIEKIVVERLFDKKNLHAKTTTKNITDNDKGEVAEAWFDKAMNCIEEKYYTGNSMSIWHRYKYNIKNEQTELKSKYGEMEEEMVYNYTYSLHDEKGNWTKRISYNDGKPEEVTIRTIIYK